MDVRETLVELLDNFHRDLSPFAGNEKLFVVDDNVEQAEYLIEHGVTVHECGYWISLTDCANAGVYCSVCNKKVYKEDYAWCNRKNKLRSDYCPHCGAKMMPNPPKGE